LFAEEFLGRAAAVPVDFKFFVFGGKARYLQVDTDRFADHKRNLYDREHRLLDVEFIYPRDLRYVLPDGVAGMWAVAERLSGGLDFVRVDLYLIDGVAKFGELTNYPDAGKGVFRPASFDRVLGDCWV
jgi:hypothetical protein